MPYEPFPYTAEMIYAWLRPTHNRWLAVDVLKDHVLLLPRAHVRVDT